jgi:hypothetical protein
VDGVDLDRPAGQVEDRARSITPRDRRLVHRLVVLCSWMSRQHPSQQGHELLRRYDADLSFTTNHGEPLKRAHCPTSPKQSSCAARTPGRRRPVAVHRSPACPALSSAITGVHDRSDRAWIFVVNPPRERPSAWSGGSPATIREFV